MTRGQLKGFVGNEFMTILDVMEKIDKNASGTYLLKTKLADFQDV